MSWRSLGREILAECRQTPGATDWEHLSYIYVESDDPYVPISPDAPTEEELDDMEAEFVRISEELTDPANRELIDQIRERQLKMLIGERALEN